MRFYFLLSSILFHSLVFAQTESEDSAEVQELKEIVIEASNQSTSATLSTYIPMTHQKKAASDAFSLLSQMAIPQLEIDPAGHSVKTITGQQVSIFINYVAATDADLQGMCTPDVRRVEYFIDPQDPRFRGAHYVINFVVQKYEWGGYTKINVKKWFGVNCTEGSVYSKFAYKRMTFDMFAKERYLTNRHMGIASTEVFQFPDFNGKGACLVERNATPLASRYRNNSNDFTFRALYATGRVQISNMLSFNNVAIPRNDYESALSYSNGFMPSCNSMTVGSEHRRNLSYEMEAYSALSSKLSLNIDGTYRYGHNDAHSEYDEEALNIKNDAVESSHYVSVTPRLVWCPDSHNRIRPIVHGEYTTISIDYSGNTPSCQKYDIYGCMGGVKYTFQRKKWSAGTMLGWVYACTNLTGNIVEDNYPMGNVSGTYSPNQHHQIELNYSFGKEVPDTYQKSPNMLQQDELMWYCGTPTLNNYWQHSIDATYIWLPHNRWHLAANGVVFIADNPVVTRYTPDAPGGTMLRQYMNSGSYSRGLIGLSATAKFMGGKLIGKIMPQLWMRKTTGEYAMTLNDVVCQAQLTWYFHDFYLFGWYMTPATSLNYESGEKERTPSRYQIQIGWSDGEWQASATAYNFMRSSWEISEQTLSGRYYQSNCRLYGTNQHMRFQFSITYTFGYGKKVKRGNEVGGADVSGSAILK